MMAAVVVFAALLQLSYPPSLGAVFVVDIAVAVVVEIHPTFNIMTARGTFCGHSLHSISSSSMPSETVVEGRRKVLAYNGKKHSETTA